MVIAMRTTFTFGALLYGMLQFRCKRGRSAHGAWCKRRRLKFLTGALRLEVTTLHFHPPVQVPVTYKFYCSLCMLLMTQRSTIVERSVFAETELCLLAMRN